MAGVTIQECGCSTLFETHGANCKRETPKLADATDFYCGCSAGHRAVIPNIYDLPVPCLHCVECGFKLMRYPYHLLQWGRLCLGANEGSQWLTSP